MAEKPAKTPKTAPVNKDRELVATMAASLAGQLAPLHKHPQREHLDEPALVKACVRIAREILSEVDAQDPLAQLKELADGVPPPAPVETRNAMAFPEPQQKV